MPSPPAATKLHSAFDLDEHAYLGVLVKASFHLRARPESRSDCPPIRLEPVVSELGDGDVAMHLDDDTHCFVKPLTDVLLRGHAYAPGKGARVVETALRVGRVDKRVVAFGSRRLEIGAGGRLDATNPEPFERMPLGWERAYGGRDELAEERLGFDPDLRADLHRAEPPALLGRVSYPRNRRGRGFRLDLERERLEGLSLPNLSDPHDPVLPERLLARDSLDWADRPLAASYEPIDPLTFPRCAFAGLWPERRPESTLAELRHGAMLEADLGRSVPLGRPDPRAFQCAPAGLAVCRLEGGERMTMKHLHPSAPMFECELPRLRPKVVLEPKNTRARKIDTVLGTVLIEPDEDRLTLTWAGRMPTAGIYHEQALLEVRHGVVWE